MRSASLTASPPLATLAPLSLPLRVPAGPAGSFCEGSADNFPTGPCRAGYYCTGGASAPTQFTAPAGSYAEAGATLPTQCAPGTYQPSPGAGSCVPCPPRQLCASNGTVTPDICPQGGYCAGGASSATPCPAGTYGAISGQQNVTSCTPCDGGSSCSASGLTAPNGVCYAGYFCLLGSPSPNPSTLVVTAAANYGPCQPGYYCLEQRAPAPCVPGTFNPST